MRDRKFSEQLMERAQAAGCPALVLTTDLPILAQRHKDLKNGLAAPPRLSMHTLAQIAARPRWAGAMLRTKHRNFGNIFGHAEGVDDMSSFVDGPISK